MWLVMERHISLIIHSRIVSIFNLGSQMCTTMTAKPLGSPEDLSFDILVLMSRADDCTAKYALC